MAYRMTPEIIQKLELSTLSNESTENLTVYI